MVTSTGKSTIRLPSVSSPRTSVLQPFPHILYYQQHTHPVSHHQTSTMEGKTPEQAITRMNSNLYPTTTIITSAGQPELVILSPLTLKEFLVEVQVDRLINGLATVDLGIPAIPADAVDPNIGPALLGNEEAAQEIQTIIAGAMKTEVEAENATLGATGNAATPDIDALFNSPAAEVSDMDLPLAGLDVDGSGFSKENAIDVDKLAAQNARKEEVLHVVLQEMMRGEHGPDLPRDAEVLLDQELQQYGINTTANIEALKERARLTTKAMMAARARMGW